MERLDHRSATPLYEQIAAIVRVGIGAGRLRQGDGLPAVRVLAAKLAVSVATVQRAYGVLSGERLVTQFGHRRASVRIPIRRRTAAARSETARQLVREALRSGLGVGIDRAELALAVLQELGGASS